MRFPISSGPIAGRSFRSIQTQRIEALFGRYPELATAKEEALGFAHDGTPTKLIKEALAP